MRQLTDLEYFDAVLECVKTLNKNEAVALSCGKLKDMVVDWYAKNGVFLLVTEVDFADIPYKYIVRKTEAAIDNKLIYHIL